MQRACSGTRLLAVLVSMHLALGPQAVVFAQSVPVGVAPADRHTSIASSANGTPVVNIAAPNAAGVSHNRYDRYDVGEAGLILNNSAVDAVSLLGGGTAANPNLRPNRSASLILNEVVTANPGSMLLGYQEILGPAAELVIANPWGVTCDGCGFINTPRVTLTTGVPNLRANGALAGFTINGGLLAVTGAGLDATRQSALDLLARGLSIDGNIVVGNDALSGDLRLFGGAHEFDYATRTASAIPGSGPVLPFAIDSSVLGGMYADRIRLLVTEAGAGVRTAGQLAAFADDLTIDARGRIELRGAASAARDLNVSGEEVQIALANDATYLYGGRDLNVVAQDALDLGAGSVGAARHFDITAGSLLDTGGSEDLRFAGDTGQLTADVDGALDIQGGYWSAPELHLNAASATIGANAMLFGHAANATAVELQTQGQVAIDGQVYSAGDIELTAQRIQTGESGVVAADGTVNATTTRGALGGIDNAGIIQGAHVDLTARGDATSTTAFRNRGTGTIYADETLTIGAGDSVLSNEGVIAGDLVTLDIDATENLNGTIQAQSRLDMRSTTLRNEGADALIIASADQSGSAHIEADTITNSGTIWSAGDLTLSPVTLVQQRDGDGANPMIGAGRDLTLQFNGEADLGAGDLQAGRDLSIVGTAISDSGSTGAGGTTADVRYAGRNLSATAGDGGNVDIGGGQWYAEGDLRLTGDEIYIGSRIDEATGARVDASGVQLVGGWSGTGTLAAHARTGGVHFDADSGAFSGADLTIDQQTAFALEEPNILQADGALSIAANGLIENAGVIVGNRVSLASNGATDLTYRNRSTGALIGGSSVEIGNADRRAAEIYVEDAAAGADAGIFGGALNFDTQVLDNRGLIQGIGESEIIADTFSNAQTGRLLGFSDVDGNGGTTIRGMNILNDGMLYDSSLLTLDANLISNNRTGGIASAGVVHLSTRGLGATPIQLDNRGEIWGRIVELDLPAGMINGRDPAIVENRLFPAGIYAEYDLSIDIGENAVLTNYGSIESAGNLTITNTGAGGGTLRNEMSMVSDEELMWVTGGSPTMDPDHNLGFLATNPYGDTSDRVEVEIDGVTYYVFDETDGGSFAYRDNRTTYLNQQRLSVPEESIPRPSIRAQGDLHIDGFQSVVNTGGTLGADDDLTITSSNPGSSVSNSSLQMQNRDEIRDSVSRYRCYGADGSAVNCRSWIFVDRVGSLSPGPSSTWHDNYRPGGVAFAGQIYAGDLLTIDVAGTVTNSSAPGPFVGIGNPGPSQVGYVDVAQPGTLGARSDVSTLLLNGARIPLPATANGRFVQGQDTGAGPLIETNPLFGLDSPYLGSEYLVDLLGLDPDEQVRRLGDDNYEAYLIQQQVKAASGRGVLESYYHAGDMVQALFENAADEAGRLELGFGKALTQEQIASLQSDIVWMVEQEVDGAKVLVPVVYLAEATRAQFGPHSSIEGYNVDISAQNVRNVGGEIAARNLLNIETSENIENLSGRMAGWNVRLDAGGDVVNSTLVRRIGDAANGADRAQRTAIIEAGNTAVITAGRDINVQGAWVAAGKDAALIAERNVNVESLALTTNYHSGDDEENSYTQQTQSLQGAGIVAGERIAVQGGEDVNITGADLAAAGTVALRAERGDVNIGVRELTNSSTSVTTRTGRYDQLERDPEAGTLGIGVGTETKTTTRTTTTTIGVGSRISGSGVVVSTGAGDVNMTGSDIVAGADGVFIDSADDVNILAYENKSETTTTVDAVRGGVRIDGSYDGVFVGAQESGETTSDTTTQTRARTSGVSSGGSIVIQGKGDVTNQGTRLNAAEDIALIGENVINRVAEDSYTSTSTTEAWQTSQQVGFTTNGTGSSIANVAQGNSEQVSVNNVEAQMRVTGSYDEGTQTASATRARTTEMNAGGNIIIAARNEARDEGTQYTAGKSIVIDAASYTNEAAADTSSSSFDQTRASGQLTGGLNSAAEVALTASAEGGHDEGENRESTARTGSMKAGGAVIINARSGDATFEGTQIEGQQGVGITAARDINLKQANDTRTSSGSGESGSARLSGSVSVLGTGGSVGAGASGRTYENDEGSSTARTVSIKSGDGNVQLTAGRDIQSQGTNIDAAGNVALSAARDVNLAAATDTATRSGRADGGGADANVGIGTGAAKGNKSVGGTVDFERSRTDYTETNERGSTITAGGQFSINAGRDARLEGTQVDAESAALKTGRDLVLESAQRTVKDDSYSVSGRLEASASKGGGAGGANSVGTGASGSRKGSGGNAGGGNAEVDVTRSYEDSETNTNATINTRGRTTVDVGGDMTLAGANINAEGGVSGNVAGDLNIESRVDKVIVDRTDANAYVGVAPVGGMGGGKKFDRGQEAVQVGANHVGQTGAFTDVSARTADNRTVGTRSGISGGTGGIDLRVGGDTTLTGAANQATDFDTQGRTTVADVETRIDESSTDVRVAMTVASAAGSDEGRGGDYSLSLNVPDSTPNARRGRPNVPDNDAPAPARSRPNAANESNDARPSRSDNDAPPRPRVPPRPNAVDDSSNDASVVRSDNDVPAHPRPPIPPRPNAVNESNDASVVRSNDNAPTRPRPPLPPRPNNANDVAAPTRPDAIDANNRAPRPAVNNDVPDAPTQIRPNNEQNNDATRPQPPVRVADNDARPRNASAANDDAYENTAPSNDVQPPNRNVDARNAQIDDPYNNEQTANRAPADRNVDARNAQVDDPYNNSEQIANRAPADRNVDANNPQTDDPYNTQPTTADPRLASNVRRDQSSDQNGELPRPPPIDEQALRRIDADPELRRIRALGEQLDPNETAAFQRNLVAIEAFIRDPTHAQQRAELLSRLETSLQGPQKRDGGLSEFPLRAQYVGENIEGVDNWYVRAVRLRNGADADVDFTSVRYFDESERADHTVMVGEDGSLKFADRSMEPGKWIFVVDLEGNLIASQAMQGRIHHSSLSAGRPVRMAGELVIDGAGKIAEVKNQSGHFRPDGESFRRFLAELRKKGVDLEHATAPELRFEANERGGFLKILMNENLLNDPSTLQNDAAPMLNLPDAPNPSDNRTGSVRVPSEDWPLAA